MTENTEGRATDGTTADTPEDLDSLMGLVRKREQRRVMSPNAYAALVGAALLVGFIVAYVVASLSGPEPIKVQVWEDGSGRFESGTITLDGEPFDLTGKRFCLYGEGCTDTEIPHVRMIPPVEGHSPCWGVLLNGGGGFCADGHTIGF